ncbi:MAG: ABC transporter permease [Chitinispirillales bacterium]|jgi:ABC-type antimicrobial peptide transport system permease subunit|nr:ABC transporter permease [Chitinispirillales bacterium]
MPKTDAAKDAPIERRGRINFFWNLARRNALFYLGGNILFCAGCAASAVILAGALLIGSSLKSSIRGLFQYRLGGVEWVAASSSGHFRESIADSIAAQLNVSAAPILPLVGSAGSIGGGGSVHRVNIIGIDERFFGLGARGTSLQNLADDSRDIANAPFDGNFAIVNSALAKKLSININDQIILRFKATGTLALDAPFGSRDDPAALRLPVAAIADSSQFGDFSLRTEHFTVYNVFVPLKLLQSANNTPSMVSTIIIGKSNNKSISRIDQSMPITDKSIAAAIQNSINIKDAGLSLRRIGTDGDFEIRSDRIFIDDALKAKIANAIPMSLPVSSWFVNSINKSYNSTPYSFVSTPPKPCSIGSNQIELSEWAAHDLNALIGDTITLTYFVPSQTSGLRVDTAAFIVSAIHKDTVSWLDESLMPPYPGLADAGSCTDWNPSIPIDLGRIRPKDEAYWDRHGGTPKAVIGYEDAARIWGNRFGVCTAVRIPAHSVNSISVIYGVNNGIDGIDDITSADSLSTGKIEAAITSSLTPLDCGIRLTNIRANADNAVNSGMDFAPLFVGLSFFTFAASLLLIWLLSALQIKSRANERYALMAMGYSRRHILQIYLSEGFIVFSIGTTAGILLSPLYTLAVISALKTIWRAAAQTPALNLHIDTASMLYGSVAAFLCALAAMMIPVLSATKIRRGKAPSLDINKKISRAWIHLISSSTVVVLIPLLLLLANAAKSRSASTLFFLFGTILLIAMLNLISAAIDIIKSNASTKALTMRRFILLNISREKRRVLGEIMVLACALYVLGTTQLFQHYALEGQAQRSSGTGGFLWYGELNAGIPKEQTGAAFLRERGINVEDSSLLPLAMRMRDGDDASCLNLNRSETPALVGVNQILLDSIGAFSFSSTISTADKNHPWLILESPPKSKNTVYGIADANTIEWGLGKSIGDTLRYVNDAGDTLSVVLAAALKNSIFQGKAIIAESDFVRHYPSISGYRILLLSPVSAAVGMDSIYTDDNAIKNNAAINDNIFRNNNISASDKRIAAAFQSFHDNSGLQLESTAERLNAFNSVENTYLSIFAVLGMMGLMLGCAGMGIIVVRGIEERRREFALLLAQGFGVRAIKRMLFSEHAAIALAGALAGLLPAMLASGAEFKASSVARIICLLFIVLSCGIGSIAIGLWARMPRSRDLIGVLKEE